MKKLLSFLIPLFAILAVSCSDNDEPQAPADAISLNMTAGENGTSISNTDIYINASLNFFSEAFRISELGKKGSLNQNPNPSQAVHEVAVVPGNYYQFMFEDEIRSVAGAKAYPVNMLYYNSHVDSWIYDSNGNITGAKVNYAMCYPKADQLPKWDDRIAVKIKQDGDLCTVSHSFPKGCVVNEFAEAYFYDGNENLIHKMQFKADGNKMVLSFPYKGDLRPIVTLMVRYDNVYTRVSLVYE